MQHTIPFILFISLTQIGFAQGLKKTMLRLPDTGETLSYTSTFGEDHDYIINAPGFIMNGNGTVTDTVTGLMWQQLDGGEMSIESAIKYCDSLSLAGYTDWRLPSAHEAFSILNHQNTNPALDTKVFTKTSAEYWWSSDHQANDMNKIWVTNSGGGIGNHLKTETESAGGTKKIHTRAVRDVHPVTMVASHFTDNRDGSITDHLTGLLWQKIPNPDSLSWEEALLYAESLSLAGYSDWRLPNIKELQSINDESIINPSLNKSYFGVTASNKYWSSTTLPNQTSKAWYLNTQYGITTYDTKTIKHYLICVRGNSVLSSTKQAKNNVITVFPNPFQTGIVIESVDAVVNCELFNATGTLIYSGKNIQDQNLSELPSGLYFLKIQDPQPFIVKLVKQ
ncbi:MAG TPA: DUF1566 domain-containing protein [Saprospiraceae bacterium]|nr:DUF1566 domain-containing protein [Saprospiraceae bacterium]